MAFVPKRLTKKLKRPKINEKALILHLEPGKDYSDLLQIAKAEGRKLLHCKNVKVADMFKRSSGEFIVVVQNADVGIENMKPK